MKSRSDAPADTTAGGDFVRPADSAGSVHAEAGPVIGSQERRTENVEESGRDARQVTPQVSAAAISAPFGGRARPVQRPSRQRSAVTNGSKMLVGIDGSSAMARRYRDLVEGLCAEFGESLTEAERLQVRNAASLQLHAEDLTGRLVRGEAVEPEDITRANNGATRALAGLRRHRRGGKGPRADLRAYLAGKPGARQ